MTREFPDWPSFYREREVETMPWFYDGLDPDFDAALAALGIRDGALLDVGTGPGTQAIELAARGFTVVGTDIAEAAVEAARARAVDRGVTVEFRVDDVLRSQVTGEFLAVLDRGCFHTLAPEQRPAYVAMAAARLARGGALLLKCFSSLQPGDVGPYRFTVAELETIFADAFELRSARDTVYFGTFDPPPKALMCVLSPRTGAARPPA